MSVSVTTPTDREVVLTELFEDQSYPGETLITHAMNWATHHRNELP